MPLFVSGGPVEAKPAEDALKVTHSRFEKSIHVIGVLAALISISDKNPGLCGKLLNWIMFLRHNVDAKNADLYSGWIKENFNKVLQDPRLMRSHWPGPCYPNDTVPLSWLQEFGIELELFRGYEYIFIDQAS